MSPEREAEYAELLAFVEFHFKYLNKSPLAATYDLRGEAERIAKEYGRSKALEGARQAANDVLEDLNDLTPEGVAVLDDALRAAGIRTLSQLRRTYGRTYRKVLRRGSIKTDTEYYLVNGLVVDLTSDIPSSERMALQQMLSAYESPG